MCQESWAIVIDRLFYRNCWIFSSSRCREWDRRDNISLLAPHSSDTIWVEACHVQALALIFHSNSSPAAAASLALAMWDSTLFRTSCWSATETLPGRCRKLSTSCSSDWAYCPWHWSSCVAAAAVDCWGSWWSSRWRASVGRESRRHISRSTPPSTGTCSLSESQSCKCWRHAATSAASHWVWASVSPSRRRLGPMTGRKSVRPPTLDRLRWTQGDHRDSPSVWMTQTCRVWIRSVSLSGVVARDEEEEERREKKWKKSVRGGERVSLSCSIFDKSSHIKCQLSLSCYTQSH